MVMKVVRPASSSVRTLEPFSLTWNSVSITVSPAPFPLPRRSAQDRAGSFFTS